MDLHSNLFWAQYSHQQKEEHLQMNANDKNATDQQLWFIYTQIWMYTRADIVHISDIKLMV